MTDDRGAVRGPHADAHLNEWHRHLWERRTPKDAHERDWREHLRDAALPRDAHVHDWRRYVASMSGPRDSHVETWARHHENRRRRAFAARFVPRDRTGGPHAVTLRDDEAPSRAFVLNVAGERPLLLCWAPGHLSVSGDLGRASIDGHYETGTLEKALSWAATSDLPYLLGKSDAVKVIDQDATVRDLIARLNAEAFDAVRAITEESRDARRAFAEECADHAALVAAGEAGPEDAPVPEGLRASEGYLVMRERSPTRGPYDETLRTHDAPDGFEPWYAAWRALDDRGLAHGGPESVLVAKGRAQLRRAIARLCGDGDEGDWRDFVREALGDADEAYVRVWSSRSERLVRALRDGCRAALVRVEAERAGDATGAGKSTDLVGTVRALLARLTDNGGTPREDLDYLRGEVDELGDEVDLLEAGRPAGADGVVGEAVDVMVAALNLALKARPETTDAELVARAEAKCLKWVAKEAAGAYRSRKAG